MKTNLPPIYFYLPQSDWRDDMPNNADVYWIGFRRGVYCWTLQTYLRLKATGFPCELVGTIPHEGIILAHWDSLPSDLRPNSTQLIACFQADRARHPYAQIHIVQNPLGLDTDLMLLGDRYLLPGKRYYMPHWSQPGLIPRDPTRGDRFENIAFFGIEENLAPELRGAAWREQLAAMGLKWQAVTQFERWHDYSEVDAVLAVRNFKQQSYIWKPASKLYNTWHAGAPAILGRESAFRAERRSELDYLEVDSIEDVLVALNQLQDDPSFRQAMVDNGKIRAVETNTATLTARWLTLLETTLIPAYEQWCALSKVAQQTFVIRRQLAIKTKQMRKDNQNLRNIMGVRSRMRSLLSTAK
jgi:hypothetical protein